MWQIVWPLSHRLDTLLWCCRKYMVGHRHSLCTGLLPLGISARMWPHDTFHSYDIAAEKVCEAFLMSARLTDRQKHVLDLCSLSVAVGTSRVDIY